MSPSLFQIVRDSMEDDTQERYLDYIVNLAIRIEEHNIPVEYM